MILNKSKVLNFENTGNNIKISMLASKAFITNLLNDDLSNDPNVELSVIRYEDEANSRYGVNYIIPKWLENAKDITEGVYEVQMMPINQGGKQGIGISISTASVKDGKLGVARQLRAASQVETQTLMNFCDNEKAYLSFVQLKMPDEAESMLNEHVAWKIDISCDKSTWKKALAGDLFSNDIKNTFAEKLPLEFGSFKIEEKKSSVEVPKKSSIILGV